MKVLCEVPLNVSSFEESQYIWLTSNDVNGLFIVESGKRLRVLSIKQEPAEEIQSAALAESRVCTHFSWNKDTNLLAIVVDKRQIYFWEVKTNTFTHFKSQFGQLSSGHVTSGRKSRSRDIELVAWSRLTDKLAICYATGQILLCRFVKTANVSEKFIDNSESVLKRIVSIEVCEHADLFACFSVISEVLVMTFDGQTKFYVQGDGLNLFNAKFSNPVHEINGKRMANLTSTTTTTTSRQKTIWLAYQSKSDGLFFKKISWDNNDFQDIKPKLDIVHDQDNEESRLVNFFWLTSTRLIACFSTGAIFIAQLSMAPKHQLDSSNIGQIWCDQVFKIAASENPLAESVVGDDQSSQLANGSIDSETQVFKTFGLVKCKRRPGEGGQVQLDKAKRHCFALVATTDYKIFYYELHERDQQAVGVVEANRRDQQQHQQETAISFEQVDEVDLFSSLRKLNLKIERASWCLDASMLAVQLTSGHILVYRTRLQFQTVASYGPRTAYLSSLNEITILNYSLASEQQQKSTSDDTSNHLESSNENAVILHVGLKPSIIAIGPKHLAVALNNRVRFYLIRNNNKPANGTSQHQQPNLAAHFDEQEYATIVIGLKLNSKFVVIQFDDGRLKLQSINQHLIPDYERQKDTDPPTDSNNDEDDDNDDDERFFPDPARPENICTFTLTESLLVYCSRECNISIFSLSDWLLIQTCDHSALFRRPVQKLVANGVGNKLVCLLEGQHQSSDGPVEQQYTTDDRNIYLYDLYSNQVMALGGGEGGGGESLLERILEHQIDETQQLVWSSSLATRIANHKQKVTGHHNMRTPSQVLDASWDTDGRTLLLVERESVHVVAVLDHTLEREEPIVQYADRCSKPTSYTILYASQGIVSYQTSLGRVINAILETHDDEMKLTRLELQISFVIKDTCRVDAGRRQSDVADDGDRMPLVVDDNQRLGVRVRILLAAQWDIMCLKLAYLRTILPIYSLPKCYDICAHLMRDEQFNLKLADEDLTLIQSDPNEQRHFQSDLRLINQLLWKHLSAWSIHCLNLDFALSIYRKHNLLSHSRLLAAILDDLRWKGLDSRQAIKSRLLVLLIECCDDKNNDNI